MKNARQAAKKRAEPRKARGAQRAEIDTDTRARLLDTAQRLFAEHGFQNVTVRDLCREAQVNLAAINYHFGDKLGLYTQIAQRAVDTMRGMNDVSIIESDEVSPADKIRHYVRNYLPRIAKPEGEAAWVQKLMRHEMNEPTSLAQWVVEQTILPRIRYLNGVFAELLGRTDEDAVVRRSVMSLQSQCLFYMRNPKRASIFPDWLPESDDELAAAAEHVAEFSIAGARAVAKKTER